MEYRIAHSKFDGATPVGKNNHFTRVVTSAWSFNSENNVLTYGATVYKKNHTTDHWTRRDHKHRAVERFQNHPVRVVLDYPSDEYLNSIAIDWFIGSKLVFLYGTHDHQSPDTFPVVTIPENFNEIYRLNTPFNEFYENFECDPDEYVDKDVLPYCFILGICVGILGYHHSAPILNSLFF